jgi:hypothetical protein
MKYKVPCWNCDSEGNIEPFDEWEGDRCGHCRGKGFLIVTELTDDNCEDAIPIPDPVGQPGRGS